MIDLPHCIHRGTETESGRFPCHTDRLMHSGTVSPDTCRRCPYADKPLLKSKGLGDTIHKITHALGIDKVVQKLFPGDCGCGNRKSSLNQLVPYNAAEKE